MPKKMYDCNPDFIMDKSTNQIVDKFLFIICFFF